MIESSFRSVCLLQGIIGRSQGRNSSRGSEGTELTGLLSKVSSASLCNPGPPAQGWHHPQWKGPSISTISQENPTDLLTGQFYEGIFSTEILFFPSDSDLCQDDKSAAAAASPNQDIHTDPLLLFKGHLYFTGELSAKSCPVRGLTVRDP